MTRWKPSYEGQQGAWSCCTRPPYSPWLNPIEMLWRHFRREVTHNELFPTVKALLTAAREFFERYKREPHLLLSVIGSHAQKVA